MTALHLFRSLRPRRPVGARARILQAVVLCVVLGGPVHAQPAHEPSPAGEAAAAEESHEGGWLDLVARLANFGILAGTLAYLLRTPLAGYLRDRGEQVRHDLVSAAQMRKSANEQLAEIDSRLAALPAELERLRAQGAEETAAEAARIDHAAAAERDRLLQQTRRELEVIVRVARRNLRAEAAELATGVAIERLRRTMTDDDQRRLIDRYVNDLRRDSSTTPGAGAGR